MDLSNNIMYI